MRLAGTVMYERNDIVLPGVKGVHVMHAADKTAPAGRGDQPAPCPRWREARQLGLCTVNTAI